ncbi:hypothetical protein St703_15110 [Sporolactobacillus terrae]|uniref:Uncharacterized protein n=1 Tax=Sporolactobacillus terrae TaxID=269673 RepID=A0A5K7X4L6_9BACL|nr:hypothetical protein St703_15110 [Sporolactobacillus terrae]
MRVRGGFRIARGKRAAGVSFVHKVMNKARMEGGSKDRAYFARFFLQVKKVYDFGGIAVNMTVIPFIYET